MVSLNRLVMWLQKDKKKTKSQSESRMLLEVTNTESQAETSRLGKIIEEKKKYASLPPNAKKPYKSEPEDMQPQTGISDRGSIYISKEED